MTNFMPSKAIEFRISVYPVEVRESHKELDAQAISNALYGLQRMGASAEMGASKEVPHTSPHLSCDTWARGPRFRARL